jgi:hypothetical protein
MRLQKPATEMSTAVSIVKNPAQHQRSQRKISPFRLMVVLFCATFVTGLLTALPGPATTAEAANGGSFNPGNIISDAAFFNGSAMSSYDIQSFLNMKVPRCASTGQPCLKDYRMNTPTNRATSYCGQYDGRPNESAAEIIQRVGAACSINPQVLLVTLQKERGLITKASPTTGDYQISMGYACPDTAPCDEEYYGFFNQIYNAAAQFQRYTKSPNNWNFRAGQINNIQYSPNASCGASGVYIENQATANLYIYTPYQPNAAALSNLYGSGDGCSAYGNRNFWAYFTDWFGSSTGLQSGSFEGGTVAGWGTSNGGINQAVYNDPHTAREGNSFLAMSTPISGRALSQDVGIHIGLGEQAVVKLSLRSGTTTPFTGTIALWGLGGTTEVATTPFSVTNSWQDLAVRLPAKQSPHSAVRLDIYMETTNIDLFVDAVTLHVGPAPVVENMLQTPSFEGSFTNWETTNGPIDRQIYNDPTNAQHGNWFAATSTPVAGRSFSQEVQLSTSSHATYTFSIHVRSSNPAESFTGTLALWGLGGSHTVSTQTFEAGANWSAVEVSLPVTGTNIEQLKAEIYLTTTTHSLWADNAVLAPERLKSPSFENESFEGWFSSGPEINHTVYPTSPINPAHDGSYFAATNTATPGGSLQQDVTVQTTVGDRYTARIWVRTPNGEPFTGTLALWALGGTNEVATTTFTATNQWTPISVQLQLYENDHTMLRLQIYENTVSQSVFIDAAQLY